MSKENKFDMNELPPEYLRIRPRVVSDPHFPEKMWRVVNGIAQHNNYPRIEELWEDGSIGQLISQSGSRCGPTSSPIRRFRWMTARLRREHARRNRLACTAIAADDRG